MSLKCSLGIHDWRGCACSACGKTRDEEHDWSKSCLKCAACGKEGDHDWKANCEACGRCGATRAGAHQWKGCKCGACGAARDEGHDWSRDCGQCSRCKQTRAAEHTWEGRGCAKCGKTLDLKGILKGPDETRNLALAKLCGAGISGALIDALASHLGAGEDRTVRQGAAAALGALGDSRAVDALCKALDVDKESLFLLGDLAEALRNIADRRAVEPLMKWLLSIHADAEMVGNQTRFNLSYSLNQYEQERTMKRFLRGMTHREVIRALGVLRATETAPYLVRSLQDREFDVSEAAIEALGEMGHLVRPQLEAILSDGSAHEERRREAVSALRASNDPEAIPALLGALRDENEGVRRDAVEALSKVDDPRAFQAIVDLLMGTDATLSRNAAYYLGESGDVRAAGPLREALQIASTGTRSSVAHALARLGDGAGSEILAGELGDAKQRRYAAADLGAIRDARAYEPLRGMLSSKENGERADAALALGRYGDRHAIPDLARLLKDPERSVRGAAAAGLAMLGDLGGFDNLIAALWFSGICDHEQARAVEALGYTGDPRAVTNLVRALRGAVKPTRRAIAKALGRLGQPAIEQLLAELGDARPIVRLHAAEALGRIGAASAGDALNRLAGQDKDYEVRAEAEASLRRLPAAAASAQ
ncbi:MAG: HEAT repeat domain-containing protein [Terracidiphilus sp.]